MRGIEKKKERRQWKSRNDGQIQDPLFEVDYLCPHIRFLGFHKICDYVINFTDFTLYFINPSYFTYCYFFFYFSLVLQICPWLVQLTVLINLKRTLEWSTNAFILEKKYTINSKTIQFFLIWVLKFSNWVFLVTQLHFCNLFKLSSQWIVGLCWRVRDDIGKMLMWEQHIELLCMKIIIWYLTCHWYISILLTSLHPVNMILIVNHGEKLQ